MFWESEGAGSKTRRRLIIPTKYRNTGCNSGVIEGYRR